MPAIRSAFRAVPVVLLAAAGTAAAQGTNAIVGTYPGNASFAGTLSQEFTVGGAPVRITRFGAFDAADGAGTFDGFGGAVTVRLFQVVTRGATPDLDVVAAYGDAVTFTGTQGTLDGAFRYQSLAAALELPAGFVGRIGAWGFEGADRYYNAFVADPNGFQRVATSDGGLLTYGSVHYANAAGATPTVRSGDGSAGWYGAASFTFEAAQAAPVVTPEPGTWALMGTGLAALGAVTARRRRPT